MHINLKPIHEQVVVITGASSGIGLATAQLAAERGASVVIASRSEQALQDIAEQLPGKVIAIPCDVSIREDVEDVADVALEYFGRIDTWINNAGISMYGRLEEVSEDDSRRVFDTNFWGVFNGSLVALPHLRKQGGALINVGSEVSEAVVPLQGIYSASKHAVKGFTDALRIEVQELAKDPVSVTLIQPTAVNTPFPQHARNYMDREPKLPTPMIEPRDVAEAILQAALNPTRSEKVGMMAKVNTAAAKLMPSLTDKAAAQQASRQQYEEFPRNPEGALYRSSAATGIVGQIHGTGGQEA